MARIYKAFHVKQLQSKMILQVHDELNFSVVPGEELLVEEIVLNEMEHIVNLSVPLVADWDGATIGSRRIKEGHTFSTTLSYTPPLPLLHPILTPLTPHPYPSPSPPHHEAGEMGTGGGIDKKVCYKKHKKQNKKRYCYDNETYYYGLGDGRHR